MKKFMNPFFIRKLPGFFPGIFLYLMLTGFGLVNAQTPLSFEDAISKGLSNNYGIRMARNTAAIAGQNVTYGNAGMLPAISAYASWDKATLDAEVKTVTGGDLNNKNAPATIITGGIQGSWTLFDGTSMFIDYEKLRNLSDMSNLEMKMTIEDGIVAITSAYYDIIRQTQLLVACRKKLEISNLRLKTSLTRFQSGSGSEQQWLQSSVIRQADSTAVTKQWALLQKARIRLNVLLAEDVQKEYVTDDSIRLVGLPPLDQMLSNALSQNFSWQLDEEKLHYANLEMRSLRSKQAPRFVLKGAYSYYENETDASFISYSRTLGPQIGVSAWISLFDGMNLRRKISNAKMMVENESIRIREKEQSITADIMSAWYDHQSLLQLVMLGKEGLRLAEKNMSIANDAFQSGLISDLQLREAQEDLFKASSELYNSQYNARMKETELLKLSGNLIK